MVGIDYILNNGILFGIYNKDINKIKKISVQQYQSHENLEQLYLMNYVDQLH